MHLQLRRLAARSAVPPPVAIEEAAVPHLVTEQTNADLLAPTLVCAAQLAFVFAALVASFLVRGRNDNAKDDNNNSSDKLSTWLSRAWAVPLIMLFSFFFSDVLILLYGITASTDGGAAVQSKPLETAFTAVVSVHCWPLFATTGSVLFGRSAVQRTAILTWIIEALVVYTYGTMLLGVGSARTMLLTGPERDFSLNLARFNLWAHSTVSQVAIFGSMGGADLSRLLWHVGVTMLIFPLGVASNVAPAALELDDASQRLLVFAALQTASSACMISSLRFVCRLLTATFTFSSASEELSAENEEIASHLERARSLRWLMPLVVTLGWCGFPFVYTLVGAKLVTQETASILFGALDVFSKACIPLVLQSAAFTTMDVLNRAKTTMDLSLSIATMRSLQLFTQSIGHDLRTPLQAMVYCNASAQRELTALMDSERFAVDLKSIVAEVTARAQQQRGYSGGSDSGHGVGQQSQTSTEAEELEIRFRKLYRHLKESEASVELLGSIVSNLWDFEAIVNQSSEPKSGGGAGGGGHGGGVGGGSPSTIALTETLDINEVVTSLVDVLLLSPVASQRRGIKLQVLTDPLLPREARGDRSLIVRTLLNLIVNALKFTDRGHVTIRTACLSPASPPPSSPSSSSAGGGGGAGGGAPFRVAFDVIDTGRGMTQEQAQNALRPYVRSSSAQQGGLGLGLTIVSKSIANAGGSFHIDSKVGVGTRCSFELVFESVERSSSPHGSPHVSGSHGGSHANGHANGAGGTSSGTGSRTSSFKRRVNQQLLQHHQGGEAHSAGGMIKKRVMLVDDVDLLIDGATEVVQSLSHSVILTASNGEEALALMKARRKEIDIVFMDIQMPSMRGDEATRLFRSWEAAQLGKNEAPLAIFACTGNVTSTDIEDYMTYGFDGCVSKPVHPSTLETILNGTAKEIQKVLIHGSSSASSYTSGSAFPLRNGEEEEEEEEKDTDEKQMLTQSSFQPRLSHQRVSPLNAPRRLRRRGANPEAAGGESVLALAEAELEDQGIASGTRVHLIRRGSHTSANATAYATANATANLPHKIWDGATTQPSVPASSAMDDLEVAAVPSQSQVIPLRTSSDESTDDTSTESAAAAVPEPPPPPPPQEPPIIEFGEARLRYVEAATAQKLKLLQREVLEPGAMVSTLGFTEQAAMSFLSRFPETGRKVRNQMSATQGGEGSGGWANLKPTDPEVRKIGQLAHSMCGTASVICAPQLKDASARLQDAAKEFAAGRLPHVEMRAMVLAWMVSLNDLLELLTRNEASNIICLPPILAPPKQVEGSGDEGGSSADERDTNDDDGERELRPRVPL